MPLAAYRRRTNLPYSNSTLINLARKLTDWIDIDRILSCLLKDHETKKRPRQKYWRGLVALRTLSLLLEETKDRLARLVGNRKCLNTELLLNLQGLQTGRLFVHVRVDQ